MMIQTLAVLAAGISAAAWSDNRDGETAVCYRRMDIDLAKCRPDSLDVRLYDNVTKQVK